MVKHLPRNDSSLVWSNDESSSRGCLASRYLLHFPPPFVALCRDDPVSTPARAKFSSALQDIGIGQKHGIRITDSEKRSFSLNVRVGKQNRSLEQFRCVEPPASSLSLSLSLSLSRYFSLFVFLSFSVFHPRGACTAVEKRQRQEPSRGQRFFLFFFVFFFERVPKHCFAFRSSKSRFPINASCQNVVSPAANKMDGVQPWSLQPFCRALVRKSEAYTRSDN